MKARYVNFACMCMDACVALHCAGCLDRHAAHSFYLFKQASTLYLFNIEAEHMKSRIESLRCYYYNDANRV